MIRMKGTKDGNPLLGLGLTKAEMAKLLQGEKLNTRLEFTIGKFAAVLEVVVFGGEDELSITLDWQKHMTGKTEIHLPPRLVNP